MRNGAYEQAAVGLASILVLLGLYQGANVLTDHLASPNFPDHARFHAALGGAYMLLVSSLAGWIAWTPALRRTAGGWLLSVALLLLPIGFLSALAIVPEGTPGASYLWLGVVGVPLALAPGLLMLRSRKARGGAEPKQDMTSTLSILWIACGLTTTACAPETGAQDASLDSVIAAQMAEHRIPGVAVAAVDSGRVVWASAYGYANMKNEDLATTDTPFMIASVSKPFTATVLLQLHAGGRFDLDDDINDFLPFEVRNPNHPAEPITYRQLLRHRSSINDNSEYYAPFWGEANGDPTVPLGQYLRDYLAVGGATYDAAENFHDYAPGTAQGYCNTCYALIGYLAEEISGVPFEDLSEQTLFAPLGMTTSAWFLRDMEGVEPAMPYHYIDGTGFEAYGHNGYPDWPAGQLRSNIVDLARFLAASAMGGVVEGDTLIDPRIGEILAPLDPRLGFHTWSQGALRNRAVLYTHGGGDIGVRTIMGFRRSDGRGVVVVSNGEGPVLPIFEEVFLAIDSLKTAAPGEQ